MIKKFHHCISVSSRRQYRDMIMERCSRDKRENMDTFGDLFSLYFYLHIPIICELELLVPLSSFETEFLTTINVAPPQVTRNVWAINDSFYPSLTLRFQRILLSLIANCFIDIGSFL
ncbi:unnamed protein product [Vicia faba]|uniref:Uncharacterized protein n=1 Tax=Vicia faba TaxID=3906 RepID=A0AAV1B741_VICFA|nr:unnamed protein product [Vicia faba]